MQTSAHNQRTPRGVKKANVWQPLESPPNNTSRFFWLYVHFHGLAELEVLRRIQARLYTAPKSRPLIERLALANACCCQQKEVASSFERVVSKGLLPFAWVGTSAFVAMANGD